MAGPLMGPLDSGYFRITLSLCFELLSQRSNTGIRSKRFPTRTTFTRLRGSWTTVLILQKS